MAKKKTAKDSGESKVWAFLAYVLHPLAGIGGLLGFLLVYFLKKDDKFAYYHAKQSLVLWIFAVLVGFIGALTAVVFVGFVILGIGGLLFVILWIQGMVNALTGRQKPLWLIGRFADKIKF